MQIELAKTAGFCFGVKKAVEEVLQQLKKGDKRIYTFGPVIHNVQLVNQLTDKGVTVLDPTAGIPHFESPEDSCIIIRAHGVSPEVYNELEQSSVHIIDATCPYVKKIHDLVKGKHEEGYKIIIIGSSNHPEVIGIRGWCENEGIVIEDEKDAAKIINPGWEKVCIVAQTTVTLETWDSVNKLLDIQFPGALKFNTICSATSKRQEEAARISAGANLMIVVGSNDSSNTDKLYEICKRNCRQTYKIESFGDLPPIDINKAGKVGITAGASTPEWIIEEVSTKMEELNTNERELTFGEAIEVSAIMPRSGEFVKGIIIGFNNKDVFVNIGCKSDGMIPIEEFTNETNGSSDMSGIKPGEAIDVFIIRVDDKEGTILLTKKKVDMRKGYEAIEEAYNNRTPLKAKVIEVTKGGCIASSGGVRIFVPASQLGGRFTKDLSEYLNQTINVRIIEYNQQMRKIVGSQRILLEEEKELAKKAFWDNAEPGKKYEGIVKSFVDFGAFVDIGGVDGLLHASEISWSRISHPSEMLSIGQRIEVTLLDIDKEKNRISLSYKKSEDNPWLQLESKYKAGDIIKGKVVRLAPFGAFLELEKGIDGLVHISQISSRRILKPEEVLKIGQEVDAKVIEVNPTTKKISLSIKDITPIDSQEEQQDSRKTLMFMSNKEKERDNQT